METLDQSLIYRAVAFILLGASGTFLLLPQRHGLVRPGVAHRVGYALVALAVAVFASFWQAPAPLVTRGFFYAFGLAAVLGAVLTVTSRNPIHSALWFASVVLATSGLFLLSGAQFLAAGTVIVYAGAIIVTFLFVIMLAQMEGRAIYDRSTRSPFWATFSGYLLLFALTYALLSLRAPEIKTAGRNPVATHQFVSAADRLRGIRPAHPDHLEIIRRATPAEATLPEADASRGAAGAHVAGLGAALYTQHLVTVELAGALLFVALIGALAIAAPKPPVRPATHDAAPNA